VLYALRVISRFIAGATIAVVIAACGFDGVAPSTGLADDGGGGGGGGPGAEGGTAMLDGGGRDPQQGMPVCDPAHDVSCLALPIGWLLVAADVADGAVATPALPCPAGFDAPADMVEGPAVRADACACEGCSVTTQASCAAGAIAAYFSGSSGNCETQIQSLPNNPAGQCNQPPQVGSATGQKTKLTPPGPTGGACAAAPATLRDDRVAYAKRAHTCRDATRCSGGTCDTRVDAPFRACLVNDADVPCPSGFDERHVIGAKAAFDCAPCTGCTVTATCKGTTDFFLDAACTNGKVAVATDNTCQAPPYNGTYRSYRYTGAATTTCTASNANVAASNIRVTSQRTLCCRP
jgi:hypothetical protein